MKNIVDLTMLTAPLKKNIRLLTGKRLSAKLLIIGGMLVLSCFFVGGFLGYTGSKPLYVLFSVVFFIMVVSGINQRLTYSYLFMVVTVWLGFWFKVTTHIIFDYRYVEPIGYFKETPEGWDGVLWVAIVASVGITAASFLYRIIIKKSNLYTDEVQKIYPIWYPAIRGWIWAGVIITIVSLAAINVTFGIFQYGLVPTILPWPLNALISFLLSIGLAIGVVTLLFWDVALKKGVSLSIYTIIAEAFLTSISILSRSIFIFRIIPQMVAFYKNNEIRRRLSKNQFKVMGIILIITFIVSIFSVSIMRNYYYSIRTVDYDKRIVGIETERRSRQEPPNIIKKRIVGIETERRSRQEPPNIIKKISMILPIQEISRLIVERWIGAEGVMAVCAYEDKGWNLFKHALIEKRELGKITLNEKIANSLYQFTDTSKYLFGSIPGPAAFFYYTGSFFVVFVGLFALTFIALMSERLVFIMTSNPFLCALYGGVTTKYFSQFGVAPSQIGFYFVMIFFGIGIISIVQSKMFIHLLKKWKV